MMHGTGVFMMFWMGLATLALIAAAAAIVVWMVRSTTRPAAIGPDPAEAEQILRRRYAAGEIDDEEYQRRLSALRGQPPPPS